MRLRLLASAVAVIGAAPGAAQACGGFFCNNSAPTEQAAEQIAFGVADGEVTAHIQIVYQGPGSGFAWILPLPAEPTLEVGTDELFTLLNQRFQPAFSGTQSGEAYCYDYGGEGEAEAEAEGEGESESEGEGDVTVSFTGAVGPYDAAVITSDDPDALLTWLADNDYDIPVGSDDIIGAYVALGSYFVALRLLPDSDSGDIAPLVVRFAYDRPCIPIKLTAIGSVDDMPIRAWVLGGARAVPDNYATVDPDFARLSWLCGIQGYWDLVSRAVDEAGGHGFVTEFAGDNDLGAALYWDGRFDVPALRETGDAYEFLQEMMTQGFSLTTQLRGVLSSLIAPPDGMTFDDFMAELGCYDYYGCKKGYCKGSAGFSCWNVDSYETYLRELAFDAGDAADAVEATVVQPLAAAQLMIDRAAYVTALATTMSPEEMTFDPDFTFDASLPDVGRTHSVAVTGMCVNDRAVWQMALDGGRIVYFAAEDAFCAAPDENLPWGTTARLLAELPASETAWNLGDGSPLLLYDRGSQIDEVVALHNAAVLGVPVGEGEAEAEGEGEGDLDDDGGAVDREGAGCACAVGSNGRAPAFFWLIGVLAAALAWRRGKV